MQPRQELQSTILQHQKEPYKFCSPEWSSRFGHFSLGLNEETDLPHVWDPDVITMFGHTNRGVSGLILSLKYSIGYLSVADANDMSIDYASLLNSYGAFVKANVRKILMFFFVFPALR